jgi:endonuclease YncB( thermonuclease family)
MATFKYQKSSAPPEGWVPGRSLQADLLFRSVKSGMTSHLATPRALARQLSCMLILIALGCSHALSAEIRGTAHVVDGDTLTHDGTKIRLNAIDAPETDQVCLDAAGQVWACGLTARDRLAAKIGHLPVTCSSTGADRYGRTLASCRSGDIDLQKWMVREGLALSFVAYAHVYDADEAAARHARAGLWAGAFIAPWDWRHRSDTTEIRGAVAVPIGAQATLRGVSGATNAPDSRCTIKGNVNRKNDRIYHVAGIREYSKTRMDTGTGERWFCSEEEADAAGWRRAAR